MGAKTKLTETIKEQTKVIEGHSLQLKSLADDHLKELESQRLQFEEQLVSLQSRCYEWMAFVDRLRVELQLESGCIQTNAHTKSEHITNNNLELKIDTHHEKKIEDFRHDVAGQQDAFYHSPSYLQQTIPSVSRYLSQLGNNSNAPPSISHVCMLMYFLHLNSKVIILFIVSR
jgi:hypothetical protein